MTHDFKTRNGVKTCEPCGRDEHGHCASSKTTQSGCADARCPFKNPDQTAEALAVRVAELQARYAHLNLWSAA